MLPADQASFPSYLYDEGLRQNRRTPLKPDNVAFHFARFLLILVAMVLACALVVGIVWFAIALSKTGRRKRDVLMLLVPVWSSILTVQTVWRYSAKNITWPVRLDHDSAPLFA